MRNSVLAFVGALALGCATFVGGASAAAQTSAPFQLQTQLNGGCLTANNNPAVVGGAVFVDACAGLPTQQWIAEQVGPDRALMRSAAVPTLCLNGGDASGRGGALRMESCNPNSGLQRWMSRPHPVFPNYSQLGLELALAGQCVEANALSPGAPHGGASFMSPCQNVTGQAWTIAAAAGAAAPAAAPAAPAVRCCDLVIFQHTNFGGVAWQLADQVPNLRDVAGANDQASSIQVRSGVWQVCEGSDYRGRCEVISADVPDLTASGMNDMISSVRRIG